MSAKHTPGRIYFRANGDANSYALMDQATNNWRMTILLNGEQVTAQQAADLERMAACWNACEGISTDALESEQGMPLIVSFQREQNRGDLAERQRDELLEALQFAIRFHDQLTPSDVERMRKIVAKATGSTT